MSRHIDEKTLDALHKYAQDPQGKGVLKAALQEQYARGYQAALTVDVGGFVLALLVYWWLT